MEHLPKKRSPEYADSLDGDTFLTKTDCQSAGSVVCGKSEKRVWALWLESGQCGLPVGFAVAVLALTASCCGTSPRPESAMTG